MSNNIEELINQMGYRSSGKRGVYINDFGDKIELIIKGFVDPNHKFIPNRVIFKNIS
jgi:hypothetical protein